MNLYTRLTQNVNVASDECDFLGLSFVLVSSSWKIFTCVQSILRSFLVLCAAVFESSSLWIIFLILTFLNLDVYILMRHFTYANFCVHFPLWFAEFTLWQTITIVFEHLNIVLWLTVSFDNCCLGRLSS